MPSRAAHTLSLFQPDESESEFEAESGGLRHPAHQENAADGLKIRPTVGPQSTLRECYTALLLPRSDAQPSTLAEYRSFLRHWERYTNDPPVAAINGDVLRSFRQKLATTPGSRGKVLKARRSPSTVNKQMRYLGALLSALWPPERRKPGGLGFVDFCEKPKPLHVQQTLPFVFSHAELCRVYLYCDRARNPHSRRFTHCYSGALWRAAIVLAFGTGPRTNDLFGLRWDQVNFAEYEHGSVSFESLKVRKLQRIPITRTASDHLRHVRALRCDADRVFPGFSIETTRNDCWKRIAAAAGLSPDVVFEDFRKTCATYIDDALPGSNAGAWVTGHEVAGVHAKNYYEPTGLVKRAVYALAEPEAFVSGAARLRVLLST